MYGKSCFEHWMRTPTTGVFLSCWTLDKHVVLLLPRNYCPPSSRLFNVAFILHAEHAWGNQGQGIVDLNNGHDLKRNKNNPITPGSLSSEPKLIPLLFIETLNHLNREKISCWFYFGLRMSVTDYQGMFPPKPALHF